MAALFPLPEYDDAEVQFVGRATHELAFTKGPLLGLIPRESVVEPTGSRTTLPDGSTFDTPAFTVGMEYELPTDRALAGDQEPLIEAIDRAAESAAAEMERIVIQQMGALLSAAGQTTDAGGRPFSHDVYLDALEGMDLNFDDEGVWKPPTLVVSPDMAKSIAALPPPTLEQARRGAELLERKRKEFFDRLGHRRLPR